MGNELRYAIRSLWRDRAFALMVVLSLAVGIGANTAIFSMVHGVLLRKPAFRDPDRLVSISQLSPRFLKQYPSLPINLGILAEWRAQSASFDGIAALQPLNLNLTGAGEPERIPGVAVSANLFTVLGVTPGLGRDFQPDEERKGHEAVVLIADSLWRRRFHADPAIVGSKIMLNAVPNQVAGVLPPGFRFPRQAGLGGYKVDEKAEIFRPLGYDNSQLTLHFGDLNYFVIARLKAGVSLARARAELNAVQRDVSAKMGGQVDLRATIVPLQERMAGEARQGLVVVMAAVGLVLMVLWVNLANLSLVRAAGRARESAIRTALGAGSMRLVRASVLESTLLALAGGALGVLLAYGGLQALLAAAPIDLPRLNEVRVDTTVLLFALLTSAATGVILGILPAWRASLAAPFEILKSGSRTATEGKGGLRVRNVLVSLEVGLSALLLVTAGLLIASFVRLITIDKGFQVERVAAADLLLPRAKYPQDAQRVAFFDRVLQKARALPGVRSAAMISALPLQGETWIDTVHTENDARPETEYPSTNVRFIGTDYFQTLRISLREGRDFADRDRGGAVVIISASLGEKLWPGLSPIGRRLMEGEMLLEVVGVTPDIRSTGLEQEPVNMLYVPYWQRPQNVCSLLVRTGMDPTGLAGVLRRTVWAVDSELPVPEVRTMRQVMERSVAQRRFQMMLVLLFAAAALALAAFGTYGVVSFVVARRRAEMGIRMALGAGRGAILLMVLRQGMMPVFAGLVVGAGCAFALGQYLASLLFHVSPRDPLAFSLSSAVLLSVAAAACLVPARRATRVNPVEALRFE
jgi:predicted permease